MSNQTAALGDYAIEFADRCNEEYGADWELGEIMIIAEIKRAKRTIVEVLSSESRPYVAAAIVSRALSIIQGQEIAEEAASED